MSTVDQPTGNVDVTSRNACIEHQSPLIPANTPKSVIRSAHFLAARVHSRILIVSNKPDKNQQDTTPPNRLSQRVARATMPVCRFGQSPATIVFRSGLRVKTLLTDDQIQAVVKQLADQIVRDHKHQSLTILAVMTGSFMFLADLARYLSQLAPPEFLKQLRICSIQTSSYRDGSKRGELILQTSFLPDLTNRHVLIVDDIFDSGHTLTRLLEQLQALQPSSLRTAALLFKEGRQEVAYRPDYVGITIPDLFVVGYGLDYDDAYRHLSYLAVLEDSDHRSQQQQQQQQQSDARGERP